MFGDGFMGFGAFLEDFSFGRASDRRLPDFSPGGFLQSLDTDPFPKNQCYKTNTGDALDLCKKLNKMGISCDMSIWTEEPDPRDLHRFDQNLGGFDGFRNVSSARRSFLQNASHGVSPAELRLLGLQDSPPNPNGFREMISLNSHTDFLYRPIKRSPPCFGNDAFEGSFMFEGSRVSQTLAATEGGGRELRACSYPEDNLIGQGYYGKMRAYLKEDEAKFTRRTSDLPLNLASMISIYGSVDLMARDQIGCRFLQKLVEEGRFLDVKVIFPEILGHVIELSIDPFGNYLIQRLLEFGTEEQRTLMVRVLTSRPMDLIKICLNTYGTRVVQKMIETVKTKQQIELVKSGLKPGFLTLVKDLNGNHVIHTCLQSLGPNHNKFVLDAATKYCAEIATHRHGCCVLQSCISNSEGVQHERFVAAIARHSLHLSQDPFGNYVVQYLIDQKVPSGNLLYQFRTHYAELAAQKFSSHVVEKCLINYPESRGEIVRELLSVPKFEHLLQDPFANYVIQTALSVTKGSVHARLVDKVYRCGKLRSSPYCKKLFSKNVLKKGI
ncbi:unnamed protein product [Arabis nemorensis]|uniref:PUM-HD domain-containing protein n=1 Tax=Arabis nemorensis TaxID=586526 RepID=A0A565CDC9_9BRAS|nr:unnamed protein product [Arabis nemorensis]